MNVVSGLRADLRQQRAVNPVYDRPIHFTRSAKHSAVVFEFRDEDVLNLEIAAWMQQRNRVEKTLDGARAELKSLIHHSFADETLQQLRLESGGKWRIKDSLDRDKPFFEAYGVPHGPPERDTLFNSRRVDVLRSNFEQPGHCPLEINNRYPESLGDVFRSSGRDIAPDFDEVQLAVAHDDLVRRQIVINVREVDRQHFVAQERERFERIQSVNRQETTELAMFANGFHRAIERRHRVITQQESNAGIVLGTPLAIEHTKAIQPHRRALPGSHADFQNEDLGRQLMMVFE